MAIRQICRTWPFKQSFSKLRYWLRCGPDHSNKYCLPDRVYRSDSLRLTRPLSLTLYYTEAKFCAYMAGALVNTSDHYEDFVMDSRIIRRGKHKYVEPGALFLVLIWVSSTPPYFSKPTISLDYPSQNLAVFFWLVHDTGTEELWTEKTLICISCDVAQISLQSTNPAKSNVVTRAF